MNKRTNTPRKKSYSKAAINWGNGKPDVVHRGITWRDFPGSDSAEKRINFTLFRRGRHPLNRRCEGLEGAALVARLSTLVEIQRVNGRKGGGGWKLKRRAQAEAEAQAQAAAAAPASAASAFSPEQEAPQNHAVAEEGSPGLRAGSASPSSPGTRGAASGAAPGVSKAAPACGVGEAGPAAGVGGTARASEPARPC